MLRRLLSAVLFFICAYFTSCANTVHWAKVPLPDGRSYLVSPVDMSLVPSKGTRKWTSVDCDWSTKSASACAVNPGHEREFRQLPKVPLLVNIALVLAAITGVLLLFPAVNRYLYGVTAVLSAWCLLAAFGLFIYAVPRGLAALPGLDFGFEAYSGMVLVPQLAMMGFVANEAWRFKRRLLWGVSLGTGILLVLLTLISGVPVKEIGMPIMYSVLAWQLASWCVVKVKRVTA